MIPTSTDDYDEGEEDDEEGIGSILGIRDYQSLFSGMRSKVDNNSVQNKKWKQEKDMKVQFQIFQPTSMTKQDESNYKIEIMNTSSKEYHTRNNHPKRDWTRRPIKLSSSSDVERSGDFNAAVHGKFKLIDLASLQDQRRHRHLETKLINFRFDTPGYVCHLLRSILQVNHHEGDYDPHFVSPWATEEHNIDTSTDHVFGMLLRNQLDQGGKANTTSTISENDESFECDALEKRELVELLKFRTGDACPSFYLYSVSPLRSDFNLESFVDMIGNDMDVNGRIPSTRNNDYSFNGENGKDGYTLIVYRTLPPRDKFKDKMHDKNLELPLGCLVEEIIPLGEKKDSQNTQHRIVAPPYQSHQDIYGDLLQNVFMNPSSSEVLKNEVRRIPQWTAWPERNHYQSDYDADADDIDGSYPASWTVFPLVYCFPASDVSARKWIDKTCAFVPHTTTLLKKLGPVLRTALFSRLDPRTTLGSHTGWADLANHVLRVHIPLMVPSGGSNDGLCGTWVDGCVETHEEGRIICFDDSKTHRAFNYSEEERIVLIIDLERPTGVGFPNGTASGGHTNELDAFIKHFS